MLMLDPEPLTEDVIDLDFYFVGGVSTSMTLVPANGDSLKWSSTSGDGEIIKGFETIMVVKQNLLYVSRRTRTRKLPVKPLHPIAEPTTPTS